MFAVFLLLAFVLLVVVFVVSKAGRPSPPAPSTAPLRSVYLVQPDCPISPAYEDVVVRQRAEEEEACMQVAMEEDARISMREEVGEEIAVSYVAAEILEDLIGDDSSDPGPDDDDSSDDSW